MADRKRIDEATGTSTVGHEWDGIEELDTPMPRWWLWTFYASIVWAFGYVILYPAWPLVNSATEGVLGWSSRGELEQAMQAHAVRRYEGPERIAAEWWRRRDNGGLTRDYYRVEDTQGRRFWLFRHGLYDEKPDPRWYIHGVFA